MLDDSPVYPSTVTISILHLIGLVLIKALASLVLLAASTLSTSFISANASTAYFSPTLSINGSDNNFIEYGNIDQQLILSASFESEADTEQPFTAILEIRDSRDVTTFLTWSSSMLSAYGNTTIGNSWKPLRGDSYQVRTFAISGFEESQILSDVKTKTVEIVDSDASQVKFVERHGEPSFNVMNYTLDQTQELTGQIFGELRCRIHSYTEADDPESYVHWLPQEVTFEFIKPSQTVMRVGCFFGPAGINYVNFAVVNGSLVPAESVITIQSSDEAVEFLKHFRRASVGFLFDEDAYMKEVNAADLIEHSPIRRMHVIDNGTSYIVRVNIVNAHNSEITYERWIISENGTGWSPVDSLKVAELHYAI